MQLSHERFQHRQAVTPLKHRLLAMGNHTIEEVKGEESCTSMQSRNSTVSPRIRPRMHNVEGSPLSLLGNRKDSGLNLPLNLNVMLAKIKDGQPKQES